MNTASRVRLNNPAILAWARTEMGLRVQDVADYFGKPVGEIESWEDGTGAPTYRQLEALARRLKRPLSAFFMPTVPPVRPLPEDHRTVARGKIGRFSPETLYSFREVRNMLAEVRELLADLGTPVIYSLPGWTREDDPDAMAAELRKGLGITIEAQISELHSPYAALDAWRGALFDHGVIVRICRMPIAEVRAFCILEGELAGIGLCNEEMEHGRIFSLFHEVCHLGLKAPGVSGTAVAPQRRSPNYTLEQYCDRFAAAFLMPAEHREVKGALLALPDHFTRETAQRIASQFKVSKYVVARRALDLRYVKPSEYWAQVREWSAVDRRIERDKKGRRKHDGGDTNKTQVSYVGKRFVSLVFSAVNRDLITPVQASRLIGISPTAVEEMR